VRPSAILCEIYHYMHQHNLYQVSEANTESYSQLVVLTSLSSGMPNNRELDKKLQALIDESAKAWFDEGLLVLNGIMFQKSPLFKRAWDEQFNAACPSKLSALVHEYPERGADGLSERQLTGDDSTINSTSRFMANCPRKVSASCDNAANPS